jgi:hypothetical protein
MQWLKYYNPISIYKRHKRAMALLKEVNALGMLAQDKNFNDDFRFSIDLQLLGKIRKMIV